MYKILFILIVSYTHLSSFSQVGIGTTNPHTSAIVDVESTNKGFLPPRLSESQKLSIPNPSQGLFIFNTTSNCIEWNNGIGGVHNWYSPCPYIQPTSEEVFDSLTINMNNISSSRYITSSTNEPQPSPSGRVGVGITNCFQDWSTDAFDFGGWIFIDQPNVTDINSANILPYTTTTSATGGSISTHPLLSGNKYFTNFSTNRKIFSFYAQTSNNTSIKFVSDSGIDSGSGSSISGNNTSVNNKYQMYYQSTSTSNSSNDAFIVHLFFIRKKESNNVTFNVYNSDLGTTIGNQSPALDDYSAILNWPTAGEVLEVYGFMMVLGSNNNQSGPLPTVLELEQISNEIVNEVLP